MTRYEFLGKITEAGGSYRSCWAAKRNLGDLYENVWYYHVFTASGGFAGGFIVNEFGDGGIEVLFSSRNVDVEKDIAYLLTR